jgi:molybdate transport repressor ModE-like protein
MLDPRHLRLLQEIARTGSLSASARLLGFTQPAASYQLRNLERAVGTALTVRAGRATRLTAAGEALAAHADRVLATIRAAEQDLAALVGSQAGLVRVAAFPSSCATLIPVAMAGMKREHPTVEVQLSQTEPVTSRAMARHGDVDLVVSYRYDLMPTQRRLRSVDEAGPLKRIPLLVEEVRLLLPIDHPLASNSVIEMGQLADATWIIASARFEEFLTRAATPYGFTPRRIMVADDYVAMQSLVAHGLGVALVPELALAAHHDGCVIARTLPGWPKRRVDIELWPDMLRVESVAAMLAALQDAAKQYQFDPRAAEASGL